MRPLPRVIIRWTAVSLLVVNGVGGWIHEHAGLPMSVLHVISWVMFGVAGFEAARKSSIWRGTLAGATVAFVVNLVWLVQGAPGHADTSDLPKIVAALTYVATAAFVALLGAGFGTLGGLVAKASQRVSEAPRPASGA